MRSSALKKWIAMILAVFLTVGSLPNGMVAYADDGYPIITSFEKSNPVKTITYKTGETVKESDFPDKLAAVVSGSAISGEVDVKWDTSQIDTSSVGSYDIAGTVDGHTIACAPPVVHVNIVEKSGDQTIQTHTIEWVRGSSNTVIDDNELTIMPIKNGREIDSVVGRIEFSMGGKEDIAAGKVEIRLPQYVFYDRDGNGTGTVKVPLVQHPETGGDTSFNYYIDSASKEVVITNYADITGAYVFTCEVSYAFTPYMVKDGYAKEDIKASFKVETAGGMIESESEELSVKVVTDIAAPKIYTKNAEAKYETWMSKWGTAPEDAADYFFVEWKLRTWLYYGTQPGSLTFEENAGEYGEIVAWYDTQAGGRWKSGNKEEFEKYTFMSFSDKVTSGGGSQYYDVEIQPVVVVKYPRSMLATTTTITNSCTAVMTGMDGSKKTGSNTGSYTYVNVGFEYGGDSLAVGKSGGSSIDGGLNLLERGESPEGQFSISINNQGYGMTDGGKHEYTTYLDDDLLFIANQRLEPGDYSFTRFSLHKLNEYIHEYNVNEGHKGILSGNYASYSPVEIYVKTIENPQWAKIGSVTRTSSSYFKWEGLDGTTAEFYSGSISGPKAALPEGTYDISFRHTGSLYKAEYSVQLHFELKPSGHILSLIKDQQKIEVYNINRGYAKDKSGVIRSGSSYPTFANTVKDQVESSDMDKYGQVVAHYAGINTFSRFAPWSSFSKSGGMIAEEAGIGAMSTTYTLSNTESFGYPSVMSKEDVIELNKELNIINEQREAVFYDLLPAGMEADTSSITAMSSDGKTECSHTFELEENWRGSGRTMLIIHVAAPDNFNNYSFLSTNIYSGFTVRFKAINPLYNIRDNGAAVLNSAAYYSLNGSLAGGLPDNGGTIKDKLYFEDLDGDGNANPQNNVMYAEVKNTFSGLMAAEYGFRKSVKALGSELYSQEAEAMASGTYTYQLRFGNGKTAGAKDIVIFDVPETAYGANPYWQGTLKGIDTTHAGKKGIDEKIYYSSHDFGNQKLTSDPSLTDLTDSAIWSEAVPADLGEVTAIAIDLSKKKGGGDYVFSEEEFVLCYVTMEAPANAENNVYAYNSAYLQSTPVAVNGDAGVTSVEECSPVKVSLRSPDVEIHKSSDPESGTKDAPKNVQVNDIVTYHLAVSNNERADTIQNVLIEDVIPQGLAIDGNSLKCYFGSSSDKAEPIYGSSRVKVEIQGDKLIFTVDKLTVGETVNLLIPAQVSGDAAYGMKFENTARITGFNKISRDIESETTYHKTEPVLVDITAEKVWDDNNNEYKVRPESIYVQLCADDAPVAGERAELSDSSNWQHTFKGLPKYRTGGTDEVKYSIKEEDVGGYKAGISDDGLKITNTIQTESEKKDVTFKVQKYRTGTKTAVHGAGFVLKSGDDVIARAETDENGVAAFVLTPEDHTVYSLTLSEEYVPDGYVISQETWTVMLQREKDPDVTLNHEQNIFRIIWKWIVRIFVGEATEAAMEDGKLVVYNDYIEPYEPIVSEVKIKAEKTLDGLAPAGSSFTFNLKDESGKIIQTKNNDGGDISFDALTFGSEGVFTYYIAEQIGSDSSIVYDETVYKAVITVRLDKDYYADVTYEKDSVPYDGIPVFANITKVEPKPDVTSVTVNKVWSDGESSNRPDAVTVQLYQNADAYGDAEILSSENGWQHTWTELDDEYEWTVDEINIPAGYEKTVTNSDGVWIITNTSETPTTDPEEPKEPKDPKEPEKPKEPEEPKVPEVPKEPKDPSDPSIDINDPSIPVDVMDIQPERPTDPGVPLTGNTSLMRAWIMLSIISALGIIATMFAKKMYIRKLSRS